MSNTEMVCDVCRKRYKTVHNYKKHLATHGASSSAGPSNVTDNVHVEVYNCQHCKKKYKTLQGFNKHQLVHIQSAVDPVGTDNSDRMNLIGDEVEDEELWPEEALLLEAAQTHEAVVSFFEEEDEEQEALLLASMLGVSPQPPASTNTTTSSGAAAAPAAGKTKKKKKAPLVLCSVCGKSFTTLDGYIKHKISHSMANVIAKAPNVEEVKRESATMCREVLNEIIAENTYADNATKIETQLHDFACSLKDHVESDESIRFCYCLCDDFYACFSQGQNFLLPSHLREAFLRGAAYLMANVVERRRLLGMLSDALKTNGNENGLEFFMTCFMRKFSNKMLVFIIQWLVHGSNITVAQSTTSYCNTSQSVDSAEFKQDMHFIGGANVKSVLRCAWRKWGQNEDCKAVIRTLRSNFIIGGPQDEPDPVFMEWTLSQDRGKLIKINSKALEFFVALSGIVKPLERFDGSLFVDEVMSVAASSPRIIFLWDELIKDSLNKQISFKLLHSLCTYFCNTWRSGIVSRRMDALQSTASAPTHGMRGVSFRPKVKFASGQ